MPRVTEEYRIARRTEIVEAAASAFAHNGFHATSMADIISASGLSAGAVYRYFRSKEEIVGAVAESALTTADEVFGAMLADDAVPSPAEAVTTMVRHLMARSAGDARGLDMTRIALQVWAEAMRSPELRARANQAFQRLRGGYTEVARRCQKTGQLPSSADPEQIGAAMLGLSQGFLLQSLLIEGTTPEGYLSGVKALLGEQ